MLKLPRSDSFPSGARIVPLSSRMPSESTVMLPVCEKIALATRDRRSTHSKWRPS
jgi:hypothetical protein